jgi:hypothetical protein
MFVEILLLLLIGVISISSYKIIKRLTLLDSKIKKLHENRHEGHRIIDEIRYEWPRVINEIESFRKRMQRDIDEVYREQQRI